MFKVEIPKILFLALDIASFYRNNFFNTNDLAELSNRYKSDLVRLKVNKKDYKYLDDTRFGGLRGNFSTLLTWRGLVKRGSGIVNACSLGKDSRLLNAICNGKIILNRAEFSAYTNDEKLKRVLETEAWLLNVRESQAHVKMMLEKNENIPLKRDSANYAKQSVFKSSNGQYFIRSLVNNFVDSNNTILQFNLINLWQGKKLKKNNLHPLIVLPTKENPWGGGIYAIKNEDLFSNTPLLINVDLLKKTCQDKKGNLYKLYPLNEALVEFSREDENIRERLDYSWDKLKNQYCENEIDYEVRKEDEFSTFLRLFLDWKRNFSIDGKDVVDVKIISSGGPDVELIFSGGTRQKLELEHSWSNYLDHGHNTNNAFSKVWIFAEEKFDLKNILKIFGEAKKQDKDRIPDVFLCVEGNGSRRALRVNWEDESSEEISLSFES